MPGLDQTDPYSALLANQEIGRATKQSYFFVALAGTPLLLLTALAISLKNAYRAGVVWLIAALLSFVGMIFITLNSNVPLNDILDGLNISPGQEDLADLWRQYSVDWQKWNFWRFVLSGVTVTASALALVAHIACTKR